MLVGSLPVSCLIPGFGNYQLQPIKATLYSHLFYVPGHCLRRTSRKVGVP